MIKHAFFIALVCFSLKSAESSQEQIASSHVASALRIHIKNDTTKEVLLSCTDIDVIKNPRLIGELWGVYYNSFMKTVRAGKEFTITTDLFDRYYNPHTWRVRDSITVRFIVDTVAHTKKINVTEPCSLCISQLIAGD